MKIVITLLAVVLLCVGIANAADEFRYGLMPTLTRYTVNDPSGPTSSQNDVTPLSAVCLFSFAHDSRLFVHLYQATFTLTATTTNIGQDVKQAGLNGSYQWLIRLSREFKPWVGVGLGYASENYRTRHRITAEGHTVSGGVYPDRSIESYAAILSASNEWKFNRDWDIGIHLQYEHPVDSEGAQAIRLGVYFVY